MTILVLMMCLMEIVMKFERAINVLENNKPVRRKIWPPDSFLILPLWGYDNRDYRDAIPEYIRDVIQGWISEMTTYGDIQLAMLNGGDLMVFPNWTPSSEDIMATDWDIYTPEEIE